MELSWRSGIIERANRYKIPNNSLGWIDDATKYEQTRESVPLNKNYKYRPILKLRSSTLAKRQLCRNLLILLIFCYSAFYLYLFKDKPLLCWVYHLRLISKHAFNYFISADVAIILIDR